MVAFVETCRQFNGCVRGNQSCPTVWRTWEDLSAHSTLVHIIVWLRFLDRIATGVAVLSAGHAEKRQCPSSRWSMKRFVFVRPGASYLRPATSFLSKCVEMSERKIRNLDIGIMVN